MKLSWVKTHAWFETYRYAAIGIAGRYFYLVLLVAPMWLVSLWVLNYINIFDHFTPADAQNLIFGMPVVFIGAFLGLRIIASELSGRSLEIVYTVPGGCERVWWTKLTAALFILLPLLGILALGSWFFLTDFNLLSLHGALQLGLFFMVLSMGMSALFRSEIGGAVATTMVLLFFIFISGFGTVQQVISPFYNPFAITNIDPDALIAYTVRNRIGYFLGTFAILGLTFMRSNRRERLLSA